MLDLKFIRENPQLVREAIQKKKEKDRLDEILKLDLDRRELLQKSEVIKSERNKVADEVAKMKRQGKDTSQLITAGKEKGDLLKKFEDELSEVEKKLNDLLLYVPNVPHSSVPVGNNSDENIEVRRWGDAAKNFDFKLLDHISLGEKLGILDFNRGSKITGAGFPVYVGKGAALERALINFMLDLHVNEHSYTEIFPPFLVNQASMRGTGQLPKMAEDMYHCVETPAVGKVGTPDPPEQSGERDFASRVWVRRESSIPALRSPRAPWRRARARADWRARRPRRRGKPSPRPGGVQAERLGSISSKSMREPPLEGSFRIASADAAGA